MRKLLAAGGLLVALVGLWTTAVVTQTVQCGGSFVPSLNCIISGRWNLTSLDTVSGLPFPFQVAGVTATGVVSRTVNVSHASILTLGTTAVSLVPAPGAGKYIDVIAASFYFDYTTAYTGTSDLRLYYTNRTTGAAASPTIQRTFLTTATADTLLRLTGTIDNTTDTTGVVNGPVVLQTITGANFASGNASNSLRITVNYRIVTVTGTVN